VDNIPRNRVESWVTMTTNMNEFWQTCVAQLAQELPAQQISAWVQPLAPLAFDETQGMLRVSAPNPFKLKWARENYLTRIEALASDWYERPVKVAFELAAAANGTALKTAAAAPAASPPPAASTMAQASFNGSHGRHAGQRTQGAQEDERSRAALPPVIAPPVQHAIRNGSGLITDLRFDNFVTGQANQLAHAAALQVAQNPGGPYNPFFLYGDTGLGKTHLMNAIGHAFLANNQQARVRYIHANEYFNGMIAAIQNHRMDAFKQDYQSLDLLLIDDIQFFDGNKVRTREEFFYVFEAMVARRNKQIIITSDKYPKELPLDSRLTSRFASGLTVAIEPPELEMRVAILLSKAQAKGIAMPDDVAFFIAKHVRSNVRELEGALNTVWAYHANFPGRRGPLSVEICKEALKAVISLSHGQVTVENIQKTVAEYFGIKVAEMYSQRRAVKSARPRQIAMFLARELTNKSYPEIASLFAKKDHTTVISAIKRVTELRAKQPDLNHAIHVLEQTLRG